MLKSFKCPQCGSCFDRASQLDYHHRSIHLRERSQICQICKKGFFRKADLRTHLNIHMGTNFYICEFCGRQFSHISNLIRHCRMHTGLKPYSCSICDKRFTQISSLARHKQMIHGIPKETVHQNYNHNLSSNTSQINNYVLKENEQQSSTIRQCHCKSGENSNCIVCSKAFLQQYENCHSENRILSKCNNKKVIDDGTENEFCVEQRYENTNTDLDIKKNETVLDQHNINMDNKTCSSLSQTDDYTISKEFEESNLNCENTNQFSQDYFAEIEERLRFIDLSMNKAVVLNPSQDAINNHEQIQAKDNVIYLHQFDKNNFIFLSRDKESNVALETENCENAWKTSDLHMIQEDYKETSTNGIKTLNTETNLQVNNSNDVSADQKLLYKQMCKDTNENKKCDKPLNDDVTQLYIELINSGMLKFDESRYCNNIDSDSTNLNHIIKSQHSTDIIDKDTIYTSVTMQNQDNLLHNEENLNNFNNTNDIVSNNEKPMLHLVQTETGEQFYEFIISNLEDIQNISCTEDLENEVEESINTFRHYQKLDSNSKESNEKNDEIEHQQALESFAGISNEFNYTQFDFHGEEKNFTILCHDESERIQSNSKNNIYVNNIQEKDIQDYNTEHLELLEHESHDFDKYVETNLEVFDRLNYENCNEKLLEFVEVADIGIENSACKEPSMVRLIQSDGEQLLELLQNSHITEQESNEDFVQTNNFDKDCLNILQNNNKTIDYSKSKTDFFTYVENNMSLEKNIDNNQSIEINNECIKNIDNSFKNIAIEKSTSNENSLKTSEESKKSKKFQHSVSKRFQCSICKKTFSSAYSYKQHIGVHFTHQQKYHCKDCGASFAWKTTFNKHVANNHSLDGPQKFVCDLCPKTYSTLSQVNEHIKRDHLRQRNHLCHCGKSFFKKSDLKTHSRTHTDERPYMCRVCGKRFHHQSHIIRHERTHSGESPFVCDICQKSFMQLSSLKAHKQKHQQIRMDFLDYQIDEDDPSGTEIKA